MLYRLARFLRHRWLDESDVRRTLGVQTMAHLTALVRDSEGGHSGEIRICVEAGLPTSYLWRHLVSATPMDELARQRALMMFSKLRVWDTAENNGVLIYLLLADRRVELVADRGIHAVVPSADWDAMVQRMAGAFAAGQFEAGLKQAVDEVSAPLRRHFALRPGASNPNQLPDSPATG